MKTRAFLPFLILILTACGETVALQDEYVQARDHCQGFSENKVSKIQSYDNAQYTAKERNTLLVENFNHCMGGKNWDLGKPKDATPVTGANGKTELTNRGIGVGVGPAYALEEQPVERRVRSNARSPSGPAGERIVTPAPVIVREPKGDIDLRGRQLPSVEGEIPQVQGDVPKPAGNMVKPTRERAPSRVQDVAPESAEEVRRGVAPESAPVLREGPVKERPVLPNTKDGLSNDTVDELKRTLELP